MDGGAERGTSGPPGGWRQEGDTGTLGLDRQALVPGAAGAFRSGSASVEKRPVARGASVPLEPVAEGFPGVWASTLYLRAPVCTLSLCEWDWTCREGCHLGQLTGPHLSSLQSTGVVEYDLPTGDLQQYLWVSYAVTTVGWGIWEHTVPRKLQPSIGQG